LSKQKAHYEALQKKKDKEANIKTDDEIIKERIDKEQKVKNRIMGDGSSFQ
jgi:hypothetical protein